MTDRPLDPPLATSFFGKNLRLGIWNCASITNIEYCISSNCDVIALQETRRARGWKVENGYNLYFNTGDSLGLGFLVSAYILEQNTNESIIMSEDKVIPAWLKFKFNGVQFVFYNIYAPTCSTNGSNIEDSMKYYKQLEKVFLDAREMTDFVVVFGGDMNAFPIKASEGWYEPWMGTHVHGSSNLHGPILIDFLRTVDTYHLNSRFEKTDELGGIDPEAKWTNITSRKKTVKSKTGSPLKAVKEEESASTSESNVSEETKQTETKTEIDGFISDRIDIVHDVSVLQTVVDKKYYHRLVYSEWRVSPAVEVFCRRMRAHDALVEKNWSNIEEMIRSNKINSEKHSHWDFLKRLIDGMYVEAMTVELNGPLKEEHDDMKDKVATLVEGQQLKLIYNSEDENSVKFIPPLPNKKLKDIVFSENDVAKELNLMIPPVLDKSIQKVIELGGNAWIKEAAQLFNDIFKGEAYKEWKTILFKLANVMNGEYEFTSCPSLLLTVYSNLLVRKLNENPVDVESLRQNKSMEIIMTLKKYCKEASTHFLIIEFPKAFETVKMSSVIDGLSYQKIPKNLRNAFIALLKGVSLEINVDDKTITVPKMRGLHLGDVANKVLMSLVMKMVLKQCCLMEKKKELPARKNELANAIKTLAINKTASDVLFHFDNKIVLIDTDVNKLKSRLPSLIEIAKSHGLESYKLYFFTNDSKITSFCFKNENIKVQKASSFRCSYFSTTVSDLLSDAAQERKKAEDFAIYATMPDSLLKNEKEKEEFFHSKLLPSLLYNCETWESTDEEMDALQEYVNKLRKCSGLSRFNICDYIIERQKKWQEENKEAGEKLQNQKLSDIQVEESETRQ